ncbi:hypothetical protein F5146DRAFT_1140036 [Armillaria mellea]|nr:hypothetical protein F5146DRAFT_1140036 [Armillaria mellea]
MHHSTVHSFPSWHTGGRQQHLSREIDLEEGAHHIIDLPVNILDIILHCTTTTEDPDALNVDPELEHFLPEINNDSCDPSFQSDSLGEVGTEWEDSLLVMPNYSYKHIDCVDNGMVGTSTSITPGKTQTASNSCGSKSQSTRCCDRKNWQSINGQKPRECQHSAAQKAREKARQGRRRCRIVEENGVETLHVEENGLDATSLPASSTGWQGQWFNPFLGSLIKEKFVNRTLGPILQGFKCLLFHPESQHLTRILNAAGRLIIFQSMAMPWIVDSMDIIVQEVKEFVQNCQPFTDAHTEGNVRGRHWFCIAGHDQQNKQIPAATAWQTQNQEAIAKAFTPGTFLACLNSVATSLTRHEFPSVGDRVQQCASYMDQVYGITPLFGLFWNFCLNMWWAGIPHVFCDPHIDKNNLACAICAIFVFGNFCSREKCWLVIWEGMLIIEVPPGMFLLYPSSLFYHFNVDMKDLEIVTTQNGDIPTRTNSHPLYNQWDEGEERGSMVWFNQATMFQSLELGIETMKQACEDSMDVELDFQEMVESNKYCRCLDV